MTHREITDAAGVFCGDCGTGLTDDNGRRISPVPECKADSTAVMPDPELPPITEMQRLRLEPGDALVVHLDATHVSPQEAQHVKDVVRAALGAGDELPILITANDARIEVISTAQKETPGKP